MLPRRILYVSIGVPHTLLTVAPHFAVLSASCKYETVYTRKIQEGRITQYRTGIAMYAGNGPPYFQHRESAAKDPRWLHQ
ncbi:hypothetical protein H4582DRAFT_943497 [Lactarius indigo]|nr:hypothetical protein H4582DRAFT_943497 [Lactarius indigo]